MDINMLNTQKWLTVPSDMLRALMMDYNFIQNLFVFLTIGKWLCIVFYIQKIWLTCPQNMVWKSDTFKLKHCAVRFAEELKLVFY